MAVCQSHEGGDAAGSASLLLGDLVTDNATHGCPGCGTQDATYDGTCGSPFLLCGHPGTTIQTQS